MELIRKLLFLLVLGYSSSSKSSMTAELLYNLTSNYSADIRPGLDYDNPLVVNLSLNLVSLTKLNEVEGYISTIKFFDISWVDERISWKADRYGGISSVIFRSEKVWTPDLLLTNPADKIYAFDERTMGVRYSSNGRALWQPRMISKTLCDIQTLAYPWDEQTCYIFLVPWGTLSSEIITEPTFDTVVTTYYNVNSEWSLTSTSAKASTGTHMSAGVTFSLQFKRKSTFLVVNVVVPVVFLSLLNPAVFILPHESGERVTFSVTMLLSFTVFENVIGDNIPKTSPMPLLCNYVVIVFCISGIITLLDTLCQRLYHTRGEHTAPRWLQSCLCIMSTTGRTATPFKNSLTDGKPDLKITWKEVLLKLDICCLTFFVSFAFVLAFGFITSMAIL